MNIDIEARPSYGMAVVTLDKGEQITAESGAMAAMSTGLSVDTTFNGAGTGGLVDFITAALTGLVRKFLAGETMFVNKFKAKEDGQQVMLAPAMVGDVAHVPLEEGKKVRVQASSYMASTDDVVVKLVFGGISMLIGGEGGFFLECSSKKGKTGELLMNAYGAIEKVELDGKYVVDSGHVVAYDPSLKKKAKRVGGWKSTLLSGEGMVLEFEGKGDLWLQTRNLGAFVQWITPMLP